MSVLTRVGMAQVVVQKNLVRAEEQKGQSAQHPVFSGVPTRPTRENAFLLTSQNGLSMCWIPTLDAAEGVNV